jgi:hypothetical protein
MKHRIHWFAVAAIIVAGGFALHHSFNRATSSVNPASGGDGAVTTSDIPGDIKPPERSGSPGARSSNASTAPGAAPRPSPIADILTAANAGEAVMQARAAYGESDELANVEQIVVGACATDVDSYGTLFKGPPDKSRLWAAEALVARCKGWDKVPQSKWRSTSESPVKLMRDRGKDAALERALRIIQTSDAFGELQEAGVLLLENGDQRMLKIPGLDPDLGVVELIGSWTYAAALWDCDSHGGCGPDHLRTLAFCVNAGCREGITYREAVSDSTPTRTMRAADAFLAWVRAGRR